MESSFLPAEAINPVEKRTREGRPPLPIEPRWDIPTKRKRTSGAGFSFLHEQLASSSTADPPAPLSGDAKSVLRGLLRDHKVDIERYERGVPDIYRGGSNSKVRKPIDSSMSELRILQLAQEGELSFFGSILKVLEDELKEQKSVTTKFLIKACCLSVEPARVPALVDCKEMVVAALIFLSGNDSGVFQPKALDVFPELPLIHAVSFPSDMERRAYQKTGYWTLKDILPKVLAMEDLFYNSLRDSKWLAREHSCPEMSNRRELLLLKGSAPPSVVGKKKLVAPRRSWKRGSTKSDTRSIPESSQTAPVAATASSAEKNVKSNNGSKKEEEAPTSNDKIAVKEAVEVISKSVGKSSPAEVLSAAQAPATADASSSDSVPGTGAPETKVVDQPVTTLNQSMQE